jgi:outer membrane protein OmpA-like peptidoglycan-associated protein
MRCLPALPVDRIPRSVRACVAAASLLWTPVALAQTPPAPTPPPTPVAFEAALLNAANALLSRANVEPGSTRVPLVIDPLIDGNTGAQSTATQLMERRIAELIKASYGRFEVMPFTSEAVARQPVVLIGTFTAVNNAGVAGGVRDAYRICLALADLSTGRIVSKAATRALPAGIDPTPTSFFQDSPTFTKDPATEGYIKSCQGSRLGEPLEAAYAERIEVAVEVNRGIEAYNAKNYKLALDRFENASQMAGGRQLRVLNGIYLANRELGRRDGARQAFVRIVDYGLASERLAAKFLFNPNSAKFASAQAGGWEYGMWLQQIASRTAEADKCLEVVGHTTATGSVDGNERLSLQRAEYIQGRLQRVSGGDRSTRFAAKGVGARELIVGTGMDDASDALDRRVEFKTTACAAPVADRKFDQPARPVKADAPVRAKPKRQAARSEMGVDSLPKGVEQQIRKYIGSGTLRQLLED